VPEKEEKKKEKELERIELTEEMMVEGYQFIQKEEKKCLNPKCDLYMLEKCYLPHEDEALKERGVEFCARTEVDARPKIPAVKNLLLIRRGEKVTGIRCIHTKVGESIPCEEWEREQEEIGEETIRVREVSVEHRPELRKQLTPEEHYVALRSFVDGLLEQGIQNILLESLKYEVEWGRKYSPLLDIQLRSQLASALSELVPEESAELALTSLEMIVQDDPQRMEAFSEEFRKIICDYFKPEDLVRLNQINAGVQALSPGLKDCILRKREYKEIPPEVLHEFLMDTATTVRQIAFDKLPFTKIEPELSLSEYQELANDPDWQVRFNLAWQEELPYEIVQQLARDEDVLIQNQIAFFPHLKKDELNILVDSKDIRILRTLARRDDLPIPLLKELAQKDDVTVRRFIAAKEKLPVEVIEELIFEENEEVRTFLIKQANLSEEFQELLYETSSEKVRRAQTLHGNLSKNMQRRIAVQGVKDIRKALLDRSFLDDDVKRILMNDQEIEVRKELAERDDLPNDIIKNLARDEAVWVRETLIQHQSTFPEEVWDIVADDFSTLNKLLERYNLPETVLMRIAENPDVHFQRKLAELEDLPVKVEDILQNHEDAEVRAIYVESTKYLHPNDMWKLSEDKDVAVQVALALRSDLRAEIAYEMWVKGDEKVIGALETMGWEFEEEWLAEVEEEEEEV